MDAVVAKVLSLIGILLFSILFGIAPLFIERYIHSPKVKWLNNAVIFFSGGTLLGITFLHLMPETRESVEDLIQKGYYSSFSPNLPIADVIICAGFFFIYVFDELLHMLLEWAGADHSHQPHGRRTSRTPQITRKVDVESYLNVDSPHIQDETTSTDDPEVEAVPPVKSSIIHVPTILTIVALSFHDIFEGLALGIQEHTEDVLFMFLSVATHKYAIAFSVSLDLLISGKKKSTVMWYSLCFSLVNPLGIAIGIVLSLISDHNNLQNPMTVLMQGVASGSLIYVVCFEVLQRHGSTNSHAGGIRNTAFVIFGFVFTLIMKIYLPHKHFHAEHDHHK